MRTLFRNPIYYEVGADCVLYHAYWSGDATDHSPVGTNDGTVVGASFVENGLYFVSDDYVTVSHNENMNRGANGAWSIFCWVKSEDYLNYKYIMSKHGGSSVFQYNLACLDDGTLYIYYGGSHNFSSALNTDTWYFISVLDAGTVVDTMDFFINTNASGTNPGEGGMGSENNEICVIGALSTAAGFFTGTIGEIAIFNSCQTTTQMSNYYNATKSRYGL